jgi:hypothetical protein
MLDRSILKDVYDLHIHTGPSVAKRLLDAGTMMKNAEAAGYKGFLVKDHYAPSAHGCLMVEAHLSQKGCRCFSAIVLNNSVGGLNLLALDVAYNMGTRMVYMPTVSSKLHIDDHKGRKFLGSGNMNTTDLEIPIYLLDNNGDLSPDCIKVLKWIAEKGDIILSTGHISWQETDALIPAAIKLGIKKIIVNHPSFTVMAPHEAIARWGKMGAYIEMTACEFGMVLKDDDHYFNSLNLFNEYVEAGVPFEQMFISSDFGQSISPEPVEGIFKFLNLLHERLGYSVGQLEHLTKIVPAEIVGA